jgi:hypothetical protein
MKLLVHRGHSMSSVRASPGPSKVAAVAPSVFEAVTAVPLPLSVDFRYGRRHSGMSVACQSPSVGVVVSVAAVVRRPGTGGPFSCFRCVLSAPALFVFGYRFVLAYVFVGPTHEW